VQSTNSRANRQNATRSKKPLHTFVYKAHGFVNNFFECFFVQPFKGSYFCRNNIKKKKNSSANTIKKAKRRTDQVQTLRRIIRP
jgi:hypothetical protein